MKVVNAPDEDRDDVVVEEIDRLARQRVPTRRAFLSEMLCLRFQDRFPLLNKPVERYLSDIKYRAPSGASEGDKYMHLAKALRLALLENPDYPAKNLAELDSVIWHKYSS